MRVVLSDTSPLRYLILIDQVEILEKLYQKILITPSVAAELNRTKSPEKVRAWISKPPNWLEIIDPIFAAPQAPAILNLDKGERDSILLALDLRADLVLIDEREGARVATSLGLSVTGTLGVLDQAAAGGLLNLRETLHNLCATNFRISATLIDGLFAEDRKRRN